MIVLDTSVLSLAYRRRRGRVPEAPEVLELRRLIEVDHPVGVPGIVLQEILSGLRSPEQRQRLDATLRGFPLLLADRETHVEAARISNACRQAGVAVTAPDCLIAAHALGVGGAIFTVDLDFEQMASATGLRLHRP